VNKRKTPFVLNKHPEFIPVGEFFLDHKGIMYRRQTGNSQQLVVPKTLINYIIKVNHDPVYVAHPEVKRTYDLISLNY
jgi:hypothetical protein